LNLLNRKFILSSFSLWLKLVNIGELRIRSVFMMGLSIGLWLSSHKFISQADPRY
jgi:hypothetical protein